LKLSNLIRDFEKPFIIGELGINHNGDVRKALQMIEFAMECGVSAVKFQTFKANKIVGNQSQLFSYKSNRDSVTEPMLDLFKRNEFNRDQWQEIISYCKENSVPFFTTPQNFEDFELFASNSVDLVKIGSDDLTNLPLIRKFQNLNVSIILSSGMATSDEIEDALIAAGYFQGNDVTLLVCTSLYPTTTSDVNISRITKLSTTYDNLRLGYSDHTQGNEAAIMAVALGASVFEKHFTLDHMLEGPDHWFSADKHEFKSWVKSILTAWVMRGTGEFQPSFAEIEMRKIARRSICANRVIKKGEFISEDMVHMLRPGTGLLPKHLNLILGKEVIRDIQMNEIISVNDIK
jgi:N,N'-diacetyllegionaminate synthase